MNKITKFLILTLISSVLIGCISDNNTNNNTNNALIQQSSQQTNSFADKQYIWQDWVPSNNQANEQVK